MIVLLNSTFIILYCFWLFFIYLTTGKPIQVIYIYWMIYLSIIFLWSFTFLDIKYPSSSLFKPSFVDCWLVCIIFIGSALMDTKTCPQVWLKIVSGPDPNRMYVFASHAGLWKVVARVPVFAIAPAAINKLIGFKEFPQVWQFLVDCWRLIYKHCIILFLLLGSYIYNQHRILILLLGL